MAASAIINLSRHAWLTAANGKKTLGEVTTLAAARAELPDLWRAYAGQTDAYIMGLSVFNAAWTNALWQGSPAPAQTGGTFISRNVIEAPPGAWWLNDVIHYSFGTYRFPNSGTGNADYGGDLGGCELLRWHERWVGGTTTRNGEVILLGAAHGGSDALIAYSEGTAFEGGFRINGRCGNWRDTTQPRVVGFEAWDFGEASGLERIFAHYCDIGIRIARGTPFNATGTTSTFSNTEAGVELMGVGNARFSLISADDNPRAVQMTGGYGRPNTANVVIDCIKSEWAVTPKNQGRTWKPQAYRFAGKFKVKIGLVTHASGAWGNALFIVDPVASLGPSSLTVDTLDIFAGAGTEVLLHDAAAGIAWRYDPRIVGFRWTNATGASALESWPVQAVQVAAPHKNQLGYFDANPFTGGNSGTFDRVNGTPTWSDATGNNGTGGGATTPPPPDPVPPTNPLTLAWASTFSGTNPRSLVATTGTTITVANSWEGLSVAPNGTATTQQWTAFPLALAGVRRMVWKGLTVKSTVADWQVLCSAVKLKADGTVVAWDGMTVLGRYTKGVKGDLTVDFAAPVTLTHVMGCAGQPCAPMTCEAMEIYK